MIPSTHTDYLDHVAKEFAKRENDAEFQQAIETYSYEIVTLLDLSLDSQRDPLAELYCPTGQGTPYDPICMLRSWLLMTLIDDTHSPDNWAKRLRREPALAILAGFTPEHTPCATAHRDFIVRYADGPYDMRKRQDSTLSQTLKGMHEHNLKDTTTARQAEADREHATQSEVLCNRLLEQADTPRDPHALQTRLDNLLVDVGLKPSLKAGLFGEKTEELTVMGDGTPMETAASSRGKRTCDCPPETKKCGHPRLYSSSTAQFCYHPHRGFVFGDESYSIVTFIHGHQLPLMSIMGIGNESDFTLGPKALDELLKTLKEHELPLGITIFIGDGHHDALPIYRYCNVKGILTVIPLRSDTDAHPHIDEYREVTFDSDGVPLCPGGCRMRRHRHNHEKGSSYYHCPAKRPNKKHRRIFYADECPKHADCRPDAKMGYTQYIACRTNPRYFPEIPRDSKRFKELYAMRTAVERSNATEDAYHVDRCSRHAAYALIRLFFVDCAKHAKVRWLETRKNASPKELLKAALTRLATERSARTTG